MTKEELEKQTMEWKNNYILKLEKENAVLKRRIERAIELLKQFLKAKNSEDTYKAEWEAEQFLKDSEGK